MNEYSLYNPDSELAHHGILGMKWGVRRYQNPDGSLTPLGRKRFAKSRKNPLLNYFDKDSAKNIYKRKASEAKGVSKALSRMSQKEQKKADKLKGVDSEKSSQHANLAKRYASNSEAYEKVSEMYGQKVKDIKSGLIKAGEDFIVQADVDWYGLFLVGTHQIITKPKNEAKKSDPLYDNVMETYEVRAKGEMLKPEYEKIKGVEKKFADHETDFYKKNPPESESFNKHFENRLKEMTSNDADGEEIRKTIRDEASELIKSGKLSVRSEAFKMAYADYCKNDSAYEKLIERRAKATDAYDTKANKLATASYQKHGADAIDAWDPENVSQRAPKYAIDVLAYLMQESCEGRR